jgi:ABC-2 type transport system permease protein
VVAELVRLKLLLTWNGLRKDWQRRVGLPAVLGLMIWISWRLARGFAIQHAALDPAYAAEFSMWGALIFFVGWVALPVVIFPLDETLDPAQLAVFPIPQRRLLAGLGAASLIGPSVIVPAVLIATNVALQRTVAATLVSILAGALFLGQLSIASHVFTGFISAMLRSRRGRDLAVLVVVSIGLFTFGGYQLLAGEVERLGMAGAMDAHPIGRWAALLAPVAAQRAIVAAANGDWVSAGAMLIVAAAWLILMGKAWGRLLAWMLVTPDHSPRPEKTRHRRGLAGRGAWGIRLVLARKELRFFVRDPRQRLVWTGTVIFVGLAVAVLVVGTESMARFRESTWLPLLAPAMVLFVGLPIALNQFGWERNAASYLFALPVKPRHLLLGKNMAIALGLVVETIFLAVLLAAFSGSWQVLNLVPALAVSAIGCQLAVGNLVSVLSPLRLPKEGTDVFAQATEQGCLALAAQMASFLLIGLLMVPPSVAVVLTVAFGKVLSPVFTTVGSVAWGAMLYLGSLLLAGWILRRRVPEVVSWVQTQ